MGTLEEFKVSREDLQSQLIPKSVATHPKGRTSAQNHQKSRGNPQVRRCRSGSSTTQAQSLHARVQYSISSSKTPQLAPQTPSSLTILVQFADSEIPLKRSHLIPPRRRSVIHQRLTGSEVRVDSVERQRRQSRDRHAKPREEAGCIAVVDPGRHAEVVRLAVAGVGVAVDSTALEAWCLSRGFFSHT